MNIAKGKIGNALTSTTIDHIVAVANDIYDENLSEYQSNLNTRFQNMRGYVHHSYIDNCTETGLYLVAGPGDIENGTNVIYPLYVYNTPESSMLIRQVLFEVTVAKRTFNIKYRGYSASTEQWTDWVVIGSSSSESNVSGSAVPTVSIDLKKDRTETAQGIDVTEEFKKVFKTVEDLVVIYAGEGLLGYTFDGGETPCYVSIINEYSSMNGDLPLGPYSSLYQLYNWPYSCGLVPVGIGDLLNNGSGLGDFMEYSIDIQTSRTNPSDYTVYLKRTDNSLKESFDQYIRERVEEASVISEMSKHLNKLPSGLAILTKEQFDALQNKDDDTYYLITDGFVDDWFEGN